jgi:GNAT superfamily N-acetyltransferase
MIAHASLIVRAAVPADADAIAAMANALNVQEGKPNDSFSREQVLVDVFGEMPAVSAIVAELDGIVVGYAFFETYYNTDFASRDVFLDDLFVLEHARRSGVGTALFNAVSDEARKRGARTIAWAVRSANVPARTFYASLGATDEDLRLLVLDM